MTARQPQGIPIGGQFAATNHAEPAVVLGASKLQLPDDPFLPQQAGLPDLRPEGASFTDEQWADFIVGGVDDGPLSRGVVNEQRREALRAWIAWADSKAQGRDSEHGDFALGLRTGVCALYERRMSSYSPVFRSDRFNGFTTTSYIADSAVGIAGSKRTSKADREQWRLLLQSAKTPAQWRGHLAAGVILSGQDDYWGLRDDPDKAVTS